MIAIPMLLLALAATTSAPPDSAVLQLQNRKIFVFRAPIGASGPQERASSAASRIREAAKSDSTEIITRATPEGILVLIGARPVFAVTPGDVDTAAGVSVTDEATAAARQLRTAIAEDGESRSLKTLLRGLVLSLLATAGIALLLKGLVAARRWLVRKVERVAGRAAPRIRIRGVTLVGPDHVKRGGSAVAIAVAWVAGLGACYGYLTFVLTRFPWTRPWGEALGYFLISTVRRLATSALGYVPDMITAAVIFFAARFVVGFVQSLFHAAEQGRIALPWVHTDTASPSRRIVTALIWLFALVLAYPYLPGSHSAAFKGISVFAGLLITLGSTGLMGQAMSGLVLMYSRSFKVGDFVRVNQTTGTVVSLGMLSTRIRTTKDEYVTLPNSVVVNGGITNYSLGSREGHAVVLYTSVTIGYDAPWRQIHELLLTAARRTDGVLHEPAPWVLQQALNDWTVEYQINVSIDPALAAKIPQIYSLLHANIQDAFNEAGVEIMSPSYFALRDGNSAAIPEEQRPKRRPPALRVDVNPE